VGIGGALAAARSDAGLTVDQVSERTRIRRTIIRAIEEDDYAACGGDFYVRGHIRAIARVVGTDPAPLIEEYDTAHGLLHPPHLEPGAGDPARTVTIQAAANGRSGAARATRPGGITAAEAFRPAMPLQLDGRRRVPGWAVFLSVLAVAVIATLAYLLASQGPAPASARSPGRTGAAHHAVLARPAASMATSSRAPAPTPTLLPVASAEAFGPAGPAQGDNPQGASFAVDGNAGTAWHSDWYAAADLNGQPGTGLLLDLGSTVTVSSIQLTLGPQAGGIVQLRAGDSPSLASLPVVAQAPIPGGTFTLQGAPPISARYVLIWFTQLPPNSAGTYEAYVYNVSVSGTA
jgi:hypothetical protein